MHPRHLFLLLFLAFCTVLPVVASGGKGDLGIPASEGVGFEGVDDIDNIGIYGLDVSGGCTFTNSVNGILRMKNISNAGIGNLFGTVNNEGVIEIDDVATSGIWNLGTFSNNGTLKIGMNGAAGNIPGYGIQQTLQTFENLANGVVEINNTTGATIGFFGGNLENSGNVYSHGQLEINPSRTLRLKSGRFEILSE